MNDKPLISILMPVRNAGPFLKECLESILAQTTAHWELLAANDHSTDDSFELLKQYAKKDTRIQVFQNKGKGIIPALRMAYAKSKGQFITRMDADDLMKPEKLDNLKNILQQQGPGHISTGFVEYFSANTLGNGYIKYQDWLNKLTQTESNYDDIYKECVIPSPCWMVFRDDLESCYAFRPETYPEDYDLCFRFYQQGLKIAAVKKVLHLWRDYATRSSRTDPNYADQRFFDLKLDYFLKLDYDPQRPLFLWGAGKKGKYLARQLQSKNIPFHWVSNNSRKTGKEISGITLKDFKALLSFQNPQIIITVAAPEGRQEITVFLKTHHFQRGEHYYFFC